MIPPEYLLDGTMEIVATDGYTLNPGDNPWDEVKALGDLTVYDRDASDDLIGRCRSAEIIIVNKTPFNRDTLEKLPRLRFITMAATGYDCVDIAAAGKLGVPVSNIPVYGTDTVAQYVFSALLHLAHNISIHAQAVQQGKWTNAKDWCFWERPLIELNGTRIGIVGFGRIGRRVGEIAHAFGMQVLAYNPHPKERPGYEPFEWCTLDQLFEQADFITLHCPLTSENRQFISETLLSRMKPTAFLVNAARGSLVNEADLAAALSKGSLAGAVVDVVSEEPIRPDNPLLGAPNLFITPHLAWATLAARKRLMTGIAKNIRAFLSGTPINVVNREFLHT